MGETEWCCLVIQPVPVTPNTISSNDNINDYTLCIFMNNLVWLLQKKKKNRILLLLHLVHFHFKTFLQLCKT